jgi:hypothetical protein
VKRILALDGGGIRGVFSLQILARIEELFRQEQDNNDLVLADVFDLIAGTSTGAIIATFLKWGLSVAKIEQLYIEQSPVMFAKSRLADKLKFKFNPEAIAQFFRERFAEDDGTPALLGSEKLREFLLVVTRNGSTGGAWPVSNNPNAMFNDRSRPDCNLNFPLWQLLRASTAAPTFFPPEEIKLAGQSHLFMDGGMTPYNNPALIAVLTATLPRYQLCWPANRDALHLISVGTGFARARMPGKPALDMNLLDHIRYIAPALIGSVAWEQDFILRVMGDCVHGAPLDSEIGALDMPALLDQQEQKFTYARYDRPLDATDPRIKKLPGGQIAMDDLSLIPLLHELGAEYANEHVRLQHFYPRSEGFSPCPCSVTKVKPYRICLADYECLLPALAQVIRAEYAVGSYTKASDEFYESDHDSSEWKLVGKLGSLTVLFEQHEGYLFSRFEAQEPELKAGKQLLWNAYLQQGGNPDAQEEP